MLRLPLKPYSEEDFKIALLRKTVVSHQDPYIASKPLWARVPRYYASSGKRQAELKQQRVKGLENQTKGSQQQKNGNASPSSDSNYHGLQIRNLDNTQNKSGISQYERNIPGPVCFEPDVPQSEAADHGRYATIQLEKLPEQKQSPDVASSLQRLNDLNVFDVMMEEMPTFVLDPEPGIRCLSAHCGASKDLETHRKRHQRRLCNILGSFSSRMLMKGWLEPIRPLHGRWSCHRRLLRSHEAFISPRIRGKQHYISASVEGEAGAFFAGLRCWRGIFLSGRRLAVLVRNLKSFPESSGSAVTKTVPKTIHRYRCLPLKRFSGLGGGDFARWVPERRDGCHSWDGSKTIVKKRFRSKKLAENNYEDGDVLNVSIHLYIEHNLGRSEMRGLRLFVRQRSESTLVFPELTDRNEKKKWNWVLTRRNEL